MMSTNLCTGCDEFMRLSRRGFLGVAGATAAVALMPRIAFADSFRSTQRDVVVSIFLRGGADGLTLCMPWGDPNYYASRPTLAIPRPDSTSLNRGINLDGFFGIPGSLSPLLPAFHDGNLLAIHACGSTDATRSHFVAQNNMESARGGPDIVATGWLGRHLASIPPHNPNALLRGVGLSYAGMQQSLVGGPRSLPLPPTLSTVGLTGSMNDPAEIDAVRQMYESALEPMRTTAHDSLDTIGVIRGVNFTSYQPAVGVSYPNTALGTSLKQVAALIKAQVGVEAVAIDAPGSWDTHADQGPLTGGMASLMSYTAAAIAAFYADMTSGSAPSTTIVIMSEFGRAVHENSSKGADHGHGGVMFVLGSSVNGGRVMSQWPGLAPEQLHEGRDLKVTIDYRDILAEIVRDRLGNTNLGFVFPGYTPTDRGVFL